MEHLLTSQGMEAVSSAKCSLLLLAYMNRKAKVVGPPQEPPKQQAVSSQVAPAIRTAMDTGDKEDELTDVEVTDSEDEVRVANEDDASGKKMAIKKKTETMAKKEKRAKIGANTDNKK